MDASLVIEQPVDAASGQGSLARYQSAERLCADMLAAAKRDDWASVARLRANCTALIESIRNTEPGAAPQSDHREKFRILRSIVILDGQLRQLAEPWVRNLDAMLGARAGTTSP